MKTYDNFVAEHGAPQHVQQGAPQHAAPFHGAGRTCPESSHAAVHGGRNLVQINTMCEDLMSVLEEKLRDINAGTREDDIFSRLTQTTAAATNPPKETSLSGKVADTFIFIFYY